MSSKFFIDLCGMVCFFTGIGAMLFGKPDYAIGFFLLRIIASIDIAELKAKGMI